MGGHGDATFSQHLYYKPKEQLYVDSKLWNHSQYLNGWVDTMTDRVERGYLGVSPDPSRGQTLAFSFINQSFYH